MATLVGGGRGVSMREWIEAETKSFGRKNRAGKAETLTGGPGEMEQGCSPT